MMESWSQSTQSCCYGYSLLLALVEKRNHHLLKRREIVKYNVSFLFFFCNPVKPQDTILQHRHLAKNSSFCIYDGFFSLKDSGNSVLKV